MKLIKMMWFSMLCNHHVNKAKRIGVKYPKAQGYHYEMAKHYFKKAFGRECTADK
jgi:hypothetical protein